MSAESGSQGLRWPLRIIQERCDGVVVVTLAGRLGSASAAAFRDTLEDAIARGDRRLVVDFAGVDYISSSGLTALEAAKARFASHEGALVLCALPEPVRLALDLAGLLPLFDVEPSRERAIGTARDGSVARQS